MDTLECSICNDRYDMEGRRPKTLKCQHSICLSCLEDWIYRQERPVCPTCNEVSYDKLENIPDNQAIKDMLMSFEVRCPRHQSEKVKSFCVGHMELVCLQCGHSGVEAGCTSKDFVGDTQEITMALLREINRLSEGLPEHLKTPELRKDIQKQFKNAIGQNIKLFDKLREMEKQEKTLICATCPRVADNFVEMVTFDAYCKQCGSYNPENGNLLAIGDNSNEENATLLASKIPVLLKKINFCHIPSNLWDQIDQRTSLNVKAVQQLCKELLTLEAPKCGYSSLPDSFICPGCKKVQQKATCMMFILPCPKLHAMCETCINQSGTTSITCPMDKQTFKKRRDELQKLMAPHRGLWTSTDYHSGPLGNPLAVMSLSQLTSPPQFAPGPPEVPHFGPLGKPLARMSSSQFTPSPLHFPSIVPPPYDFSPASSPDLQYKAGLPLPEFPRTDNLQQLVRFPSVLPVPNLLGNTNNKGWFINFSENHVDAVTMTVLDTCRLVGLGIANPVSPSDVAMIESVSLYNGKTATGNVIANHQGGQLLKGGNQLLTYFYLQTPFLISAFSPVTLKVKIVSAPSHPSTGVQLYRGSPYQRPDIWSGTDGLTWDFEETYEVGVGESKNGQNDLSGPILAFLYRH